MRRALSYSSNAHCGSGSHAWSHSAGMAPVPVRITTTPPTIAQVVSQSPSGARDGLGELEECAECVTNGQASQRLLGAEQRGHA
ncbi:MAG: hypothetical protein OHK0022_38110 [Roseiflexaceae bacterium]